MTLEDTTKEHPVMADPIDVPPIVTPWYLDKSLWLTIVGFLFTFLNKKIGLNLDANEVVPPLVLLVAYIASSKWKQASATKSAALITTTNALIDAGVHPAQLELARVQAATPPA